MVARSALWIWAGLTAALYAALAYGSYFTLPSLAGGVLGFDMRPFGMSGPDGVAYLEGVTKAGREYYLTWLIHLDHLFIAALTLLLIAVAWPMRGVTGALAATAALAYAGMDVAENHVVKDLMTRPADARLADGVERVSTTTTLKFACLGVALLTIAIGWWIRRENRG